MNQNKEPTHGKGESEEAGQSKLFRSYQGRKEKGAVSKSAPLSAPARVLEASLLFSSWGEMSCCNSQRHSARIKHGLMSSPLQPDDAPWQYKLQRMKHDFPTQTQPNSANVEVWASYLEGKIDKLIARDICEACVAVDVPKDLAARLIERLQAGGQRFLSWEVDKLVTIYLYADPGPVHEQVIDDVRDVIKLSLAEVPGCWSDVVRSRGSEVHDIQVEDGVIWKEADVCFKHKERAKIIPGEHSSNADMVVEVAVKNETAPRCIEESIWWTDQHCAKVCLVVKIYLHNEGSQWLKPFITAFLTSTETSGKVMRGPIELGAYGECLGPGCSGCCLNMSSEIFTGGTSDPLARHVVHVDMFKFIATVYEDMELDHNPQTNLPPTRPNPLSLEKLQEAASNNGYTLNLPVTRSTLAWFS